MVVVPAVIPDYLNEARQNTQSAGNVLTSYAGKENTISDELKKVLNEATTPGKTDWADIRSTTLSDYLASPQQARAKYRDPESENFIFNPAQSSRAMAEYVQGSEIPFLSANTLFSMMTEQEPEMIQSGANVFKAQQGAAQTAYNVANQIYSNLMGEFELSERSRMEEDRLSFDTMRFGEDKRAQAEAEKLAREQFEFQKTKESGGSDLGSSLSLIQSLLNGDKDVPGQPDISGLDEALEEDIEPENLQNAGNWQANIANFLNPLSNNFFGAPSSQPDLSKLGKIKIPTSLLNLGTGGGGGSATLKK